MTISSVSSSSMSSSSSGTACHCFTTSVGFRLNVPLSCGTESPTLMGIPACCRVLTKANAVPEVRLIGSTVTFGSSVG